MKLVRIPQSFVNECRVVWNIDFFESTLSMPYIILPLADVLTIAKDELSISTFLVLQPTSLVVHMRVLVKIYSLL